MSAETTVDGNPLVARILADARAEAGRMEDEARESARKRLEASAEECRGIEREAAMRAAARIEVVKRNAASRTTVETRRQQLRIRDRVAAEAQEAVRARLAAMIGGEPYRRMLVGWVAEAAIGLGEAEAQVNSSAAERPVLDRALLAEAEADVLATTGRKVSLAPSTAQPLLGQGIVVTSTNGRVAYNNQVATRLLREQARIRALTHQGLFAGDEGDRA